MRFYQKSFKKTAYWLEWISIFIKKKTGFSWIEWVARWNTVKAAYKSIGYDVSTGIFLGHQPITLQVSPKMEQMPMDKQAVLKVHLIRFAQVSWAKCPQNLPSNQQIQLTGKIELLNCQNHCFYTESLNFKNTCNL